MVDAVTLALLDGSQAWMRDLLLPAGLLLITVAVFARLRRRRRAAAGEGGGAQLTAGERLERYRQERGVRNDLESLMVEIEQLSKHMGAQLDAKTIQLENLIREADERLERLSRAAGDAPGSSPARSDPPAAPPAANDQDPLARHVCELAGQGLSPVDIARRLNEHVGKVELILALNRASEAEG